MDTKIGVLGDGGWGTALSLLLAEKGFPVRLWGAFPKYTEELRSTRENRKFLPGFKIPETVELSSDITATVRWADLVVLAIPSQYMRSVVKRLRREKKHDKLFVSVAKGIETTSLRVMSRVVHEELGNIHFCALSGPTIAREVAQKIPAAATVAAHNQKVVTKVRKIFSTDYFSLYENDDVLGVELGGSVKNVIAISAGIVSGLGYGTNTQAALFARGVAEMARLGRAMGAKRETFMGLSGLGDLATTCLSPLSRNRSLGVKIGEGIPLQKALKESEMVVEGVETSRAVFKLARRYKVSMPICASVHGILFKRQNPRQAIKALLQRKPYKEKD